MIPRTWKVRVFTVFVAMLLSITGLFLHSEWINRQRPIPCDASLDEIHEIMMANFDRVSLWDRIIFPWDSFDNGEEESNGLLTLVECVE